MSLECFHNYFLSSFNIPVSNQSKTNMNFLKKYQEPKKSILLPFQNEIKTIYEKLIPNPSFRADLINKILTKNKNKKLDDLNTIYQNLISLNPTDYNIISFSKLFSIYLSQNKKFIDDTLSFQKVIQNLPKNNIAKNDLPISYKNPIQIYNYSIEHNYILYDSLLQIISKIHNQELQSLSNIGFSNLYFGNYIDLHQPSIGPIYPVLGDMKNVRPNQICPSIYSMMIHILNGDNHFIEQIPLKSMNIHKMIRCVQQFLIQDLIQIFQKRSFHGQKV